MTATATDLPRLLERGDELERLREPTGDVAAGRRCATAVFVHHAPAADVRDRVHLAAGFGEPGVESRRELAGVPELRP